MVTGFDILVIKNPDAASVKGIRDPNVIECSTAVFKLVESIYIFSNKFAAIVSVQVTTRSSTKQSTL